ncbi:hypothetical protein COEREDRAFT_81043 [Coemansia reversa NRRL 1564]|uniref:Attractin/MKLN-like beta-propeller domain-containing protein n=1 Tax=Coemansia reversa (strain ATCC 12441 / NRRL 1564) TaxID=763665 RepID=A0A2G5BCD4_COERN|nr:hypothetical protein COEREDRAFT_81043 [Coemansia reversa NRRL 1564]|eukprot:PIA16675.1 hypothetical protein COEREDRAFT_81043 [Coemansia reversa NRRL 1564]
MAEPLARRAGAVGVPRSTEEEEESQYSSGMSVRWAHTSVIADKTLYVFGGKSGTGNSKDDYAPACVSLDLSAKFTTSNTQWSTACSKNGPLVAGHSAVINPGINMVALFGGTTPDDYTRRSSPLNLYSAEIRTWNTPDDNGFSKPLVNHSASLDPVTGDIVYFGGVFRDNMTIISNSVLAMVTDPEKHVELLPSPLDPLIIVKPASTSKSSVELPTAESHTTVTRTTTIMQPATSPRSSASTSNEATTTGASSPDSEVDLELDALFPSQSPRPTLSDADDNQKDRLFDLLPLVRRSDRSVDDELLMTWTNTTLPDGVVGRVGHTASIVDGTSMVVLGGASTEGKLAGMQTILIYNIKTQVWTQRTTSGNAPPARRDHVATVVNDTGIVIHGGTNADFLSAYNDVAMLNTTTWTWFRPHTTNAPSGRYAHSAVQAGPYMILTFGYAPDSPTHVDSADFGLYLLDTTTWQFVDQYDPSRAMLSMLYKKQKITGGTIFGLLIASVVSLLVLLVMAYILCAHYYNRHPRLSDNGETTNMLPTTELRNLGRKITVRLGTQRQRHRRAEALRRAAESKIGTGSAESEDPAAQRRRTMYLTNQTTSNLNLAAAPRLSDIPGITSSEDHNMHIMYETSRDSSMDLSISASGMTAQNPKPSTDGARMSRRTHLDDVELPAGLRNRADISTTFADSSAKTGAAISVGDLIQLPETLQRRASKDSSLLDNGNWSRPTTANSEMRQVSTHISDMLPRIVGSRLTLPPEPASALTRYRFDELEVMSNTPAISEPPPLPVEPFPSNQGTGISSSASALTSVIQTPAIPRTGSAADVGATGASHNNIHPASPYLRHTTVNKSNSEHANNNLAKPAAPFMKKSSDLRDSIDITTVLSQNQHFYVANPDD